MTPARILLSFAVVAAGLLAAGPARAHDANPTAPPPAAKPATTNLDEWLAFVDGEFITRRMIQREIGERAEGESEAEYEAQVHGRALRRVLEGVLVRQAKLEGLEIRPDQVDKYVEKASSIEVEQAREREEQRKPGAGRDITFQKILAERGQTLDEFKEMVTRQVLIQNYWYILERGIPGKRRQVDAEASPEDCLRLWRAHRDRFDQKQGVRLVRFAASPESFLDDGKRTYEQAVEAARAHLQALLGELRAGRPPEEVARSHGVARSDWSSVPAGKWIEAGTRGTAMAADEWAFDPARKAGDSGVFDAARGMLVGYYVLEVRPARKLTYEEVLPDLIAFIHDVRVDRFRIQHTLECLSSATIQPPEVGSELESQFREALKSIDEDPVKKTIRQR